MELAEVKKYFENAEKVISNYGKESKIEVDEIHEWNNGFWYGDDCSLWSKKKGFAKILTTKEPSFSITKDQIRQLTDPKVKEWFPEVFNLSKDFTGWVKTKGELNKKWIFYFENGFQKYGICPDGNWFIQNMKVCLTGNEFEANEQEVFEALKNEAVRRGFVEGACFKDLHTNYEWPVVKLHWREDSEDLRCECGCVFHNGVWATIIPTITKSEAEKLLNKKIID